MKSEFLQLTKADFWKGLVVAVFMAILSGLVTVFSTPASSFKEINWFPVFLSTALAFCSYMLKNLFTNSDGQILHTENTLSKALRKQKKLNKLKGINNVVVNIEVQRVAFRDTYTIGLLFLDGVKICDTLEDKYRDLSKEAKVWGQTAIPEGVYKCVIVYWNKIKRNVLALLNVPQFSGILVHGGYDQDNTEGCILVGYNTIIGHLTDSKKALDIIMNYIATKNPSSIVITVKNLVN